MWTQLCRPGKVVGLDQIWWDHKMMENVMRQDPETIAFRAMQNLSY